MGKKGLIVVTSILAVMTIVFGVISAVLMAMKHHQDDHGEFSKIAGNGMWRGSGRVGVNDADSCERGHLLL